MGWIAHFWGKQLGWRFGALVPLPGCLRWRWG